MGVERSRCTGLTTICFLATAVVSALGSDASDNSAARTPATALNAQLRDLPLASGLPNWLTLSGQLDVRDLVGVETDAVFGYQINPRTSIGAGVGRLIPGA